MKTFEELEKLTKYHNLAIKHANESANNYISNSSSFLKIKKKFEDIDSGIMLVVFSNLRSIGLYKSTDVIGKFIDYAEFTMDGLKINEEQTDEFTGLKELILKAEKVLSKFMREDS